MLPTPCNGHPVVQRSGLAAAAAAGIHEEDALTEYRKDVEDEIFSGCGFTLPLIRSYNEARDIASHWLANDSERIETAEAMRRFVLQKYSAENNAERIRERLGKY